MFATPSAWSMLGYVEMVHIEFAWWELLSFFNVVLFYYENNISLNYNIDLDLFKTYTGIVDTSLLNNQT